ncbi:hypothetical protein HYE82_10540 [Streptomyces sp. BR123]|uniref:hypothetical protein n=1 Tax=Streptomyces sp. BR123 TaxID=2749828 RepID=UPI0015C4B179|nr:hypothetical protein [Streptomyces sp. BR123]NXY94823.1 hypothetical protein [Streptomyces sp. BR123]
MRTHAWTAGAVLALALLGGVHSASAATPVGPAKQTAVAATAPILVGYYGTSEECYEAGSMIVGEHGCVYKGAKGWALYVFL